MNKIDEMLQMILNCLGSGNLHEAETLCRQILAASPDNPDATHILGIIAFNVRRYDAAKILIKRAIELMPHNPACYNNMGNVYQSEGEYSKAMVFYKKTIELSPQHINAYSNLSVAYSKLGMLEKAYETLEYALRLDPSHSDRHPDLNDGQFDTHSEKQVSRLPGYADARWNRALLLLLNGDFKKGWAEYEWRFMCAENPTRNINTGRPWDGKPFPGKTILVHEEQGMGDTFQFIRYLPMVKQMGGHVIFEALPTMIRLVQSLDCIDRLWVRKDEIDSGAVDRFDYRISLMSLPSKFNTTLENIPADIPYIKADQSLTRIWEKRINNDDSYKVGIAWAGSPDNRNDINRSIPLSDFSVLKEIKGVTLYSLQKDKYENWTDMDPNEIFESDLGAEISDFADTAAIIENLDLIISIDTALVHLAGAMGKEIWTLLPSIPDWRWMQDRDDSPWYPTMTLFRQPDRNDWKSVFKKIREKLQALVPVS